ncbi:MAG: hypothetical protein ACRC8L_06755, partial [Plesiomonas shigelloides]
RAAPANSEERRLLGIRPDDSIPITLFHPEGCPECNFKGFRGRTGIHELMVVDEALRILIHQRAGEPQMESHLRALRPGIRGNGLQKVLAGETSLDEVLRVTQEG